MPTKDILFERKSDSRRSHCIKRWHGQEISCVAWPPALAPTLAVKISAAYQMYFGRNSGSRRSVPKKVALPGHVMRATATCLSTHPGRHFCRCMALRRLGPHVETPHFEKFPLPGESSEGQSLQGIIAVADAKESSKPSISLYNHFMTPT